MSTVERAIAIAAAAHSGQIDKAGAPYVFHVLRVMISVETEMERIVAVLHDLVEDTDWTLERLRLEGFSEQVICSVDALTHRHGESYEEFVIRVCQNQIGRRVKLADLADNCDLRRIVTPNREDYERLAKYQRAIKLLGGEVRISVPGHALRDQI